MRAPRTTGPAVLAALGALLAVLLAACGIPTDSEPRPLADPTTSVPRVETGGSTDAVVYLWNQDDEQVVRTTRGIEPPATPQAVLNALLVGPLPADIEQGLTTNIPADTSGTVEVADGTAFVDMSASWGELNRPGVTYAYAQVVGTLCALDGIDAVTFLVEGMPVDSAPTVNDGEKSIVTPEDYAELGLEGE
jgi:spore germination protein GerM